MLVSTRLWIYRARAAKRFVYRKGGFYREFIVTTIGDPEFEELLKGCEKPVYGMLIGRKEAEDVYSKSEAIGLRTILMDLKTNGNYEQDILLIPTFIGREQQTEVIAERGNSDQYSNRALLREGVRIKKAMLFSEENPTGFSAAEFIMNPLKLLKDRSALVNQDRVANSSCIAKAIWKSRSKIKIINNRTFSGIVKSNYNID